MDDQILKEVIIAVAMFPVAWLILKWIFQKSIMFRFSFITVGLMIFINFTGKLTVIMGGNTQFITLPVNLIVGTLVYYYLNKKLRRPLDKSINQVKELSEGKLNLMLAKSKSKDELGILNNSLITLSKILNDVVSNLLNSSGQMIQMSQGFSASSEQLSQGANEQASSIEEVSAAMEQISANTEENTENAQRTEKVSEEAHLSIKSVAEKMEKAIEANREIAEKITVINDIADKTDLLAINASIEAARAREHGKGFAVVASEVRKLSEKSKIAAEEIVALTKIGYEITKEVGKLMSDTMPKIEVTTSLVQGIVAAGMEQNNGIGQVNSAIQQLNNVTQQNASSSEELASSAEQLTVRSEQSKRVIQFFKLENDSKHIQSATLSPKKINKSLLRASVMSTV